jgi:hypothetical protein
MASVRATVVQTHLDGIERDLVPGVVAALDHIPAESLEMIRSASRVGWVDMEPNLLLNEGIYKAIGIERGRSFYTLLYTEFFNGALFRTFLNGIRALGRPDPGSYIKHAPRAWDMLWRGFGHVEVASRTDQSIELSFHEQPQRLFEPQLPWFEYLAAVYEVAFLVCEVDGWSEVTLKRPGEGLARIRFDWKRADESSTQV